MRGESFAYPLKCRLTFFRRQTSPVNVIPQISGIYIPWSAAWQCVAFIRRLLGCILIALWLTRLLLLLLLLLFFFQFLNDFVEFSYDLVFFLSNAFASAPEI